MKKSRTFKIDYFARIEGEAGLQVKIKDDEVVDVKLNIFEPPRFFESFLRGRSYNEVPDLTSRICGICPVAHQMSSVHAIENAFGIKVDGQLRALRRLIYLGEWIESHALHIYLLHAPDFLGYSDAIGMARDHGGVVKRGLKLKKIGNEIVSKLGGREIHPINVCVGGFYRVPTVEELLPLVERLKWACEAALETVRWVSSFSFPDFKRDYEFVSLTHPDEYPINEGRIISNKGLDIVADEFESYVKEEHVKHSNALHATLKDGGPYLVGPLARFSLNFDKLSKLAKEAAVSAGLTSSCNNPFKSIIVRGVELVYACDEALRIVDSYVEPDKSALDVEIRPSSGSACTEAPRGILYHRYKLSSDGVVNDANIIPPTSQNQKTIQDDILKFIPSQLDAPTEELRLTCAQLVRNHDPCISCATHQFKLDLKRE